MPSYCKKTANQRVRTIVAIVMYLAWGPLNVCNTFCTLALYQHLSDVLLTTHIYMHKRELPKLTSPTCRLTSTLTILYTARGVTRIFPQVWTISQIPSPPPRKGLKYGPWFYIYTTTYMWVNCKLLCHLFGVINWSHQLLIIIHKLLFATLFLTDRSTIQIYCMLAFAYCRDRTK